MKRVLIAAFLIVIMCGTAYASMPRTSSKEVNHYIKQFDGRVGVYAVNLRTRKSFSYNRDMVFPTASTSKLVVSLAVYKYLYPAADVDTKERYDDYIARMIHVSDNEAFYELLNEFDENHPKLLGRTVRDMRLRTTAIHDKAAYARYGYHSITTPKEMAEVFQTIYRGKYLGTEKTNFLKDELASTVFREEMPRYMETPVLHKIGELNDVLCDVGIVDDGKDQILMSIFTASFREDQYKSDFIAVTAAKIYNLLRR